MFFSSEGATLCTVGQFVGTKETQYGEKGQKTGLFQLVFDWCIFDPHINEAGLYKPRFFQVRHRKSSSLGEALSVWIAFFSARSLLLYFNCSFQNKVFTVWFVNCSFENKSLFYCCNCSSWNNIVAVSF